MPEEKIYKNIILLPVSKIVHSRSFEKDQRLYGQEDFDGLVDSIKNTGVTQPVWVSAPSDNGIYMIIDGDHRLEAARKLNLEAIPAIVDESISVNDDDEIEPDVKNLLLNWRRVNPTFSEMAKIFRKIEGIRPSEVEKIREKMGISAAEFTYIADYNRLDEKSRKKLEKFKLDNKHKIVEAAHRIRSAEERSEYIERALSAEDKRSEQQIVEYLMNAGRVTSELNFSNEVKSHFNKREIPLDCTKAIDLIACYDTEEEQLAIINRLTLVDDPSIIASEFYRLVQNSMTACPELKNLITEPSFPESKQTINAILSFRNVYPDEPEKRLAVISSLFAQNRLNPDALARITNNIEKSLNSYPEEIQEMFFDGHLPFSDLVFSSIDHLLSKKWDLPTSIDLIEKASAGKFQPDQFQSRITKLIREYDETFSIVARNEDGTQNVITSVDDAVKNLGLTEEEMETWSRITGDKSDEKDSEKKPEKLNLPVKDVPAKKEESQAEEESPFADEDPDDFYSTEYHVLADSLQRFNNSTDLKFEEELLEKNRTKKISGEFVFDEARKYCEKCHKNRSWNFSLVNYCLDCFVPVIVGAIEDKEDDE